MFPPRCGTRPMLWVTLLVDFISKNILISGPASGTRYWSVPPRLASLRRAAPQRKPLGWMWSSADLILQDLNTVRTTCSQTWWSIDGLFLLFCFFYCRHNKSKNLAVEGLKWEIRYIFNTYCKSGCPGLSRKVVNTPSHWVFTPGLPVSLNKCALTHLWIYWVKYRNL